MAGRSEEAVRSGLSKATPREVLDRFVAAFHARDWDTLRDLFSPQLQGVDRRTVGWGRLDGPDEYMKYVEELVALAPDVRLSLTPLASGPRAAVSRVTQRGHLAAGGGAMELGYAVLVVVADDRITHVEYFEPEDYKQAIVRLEEIADTEPGRLGTRATRALNTRDWDTLAECFAENAEMIDRRALGWEGLRGRDAILEMYRSWVEIVPDLEDRVEQIASDDEHIVARVDGHGHAADGGGEMEYFVIAVSSVRDGRVVRVELFDSGDEPAALARYDQLRGRMPPTVVNEN